MLQFNKMLDNIFFCKTKVENWINIRNTKNYTFWIINVDDECVTGYFDGFDSLNDKECDHFLTYRNYYYYRSIQGRLPYSTDDLVKYEDDNMIEIDSIQNENTIKHMINIRKELIKKVNILTNKLENSKIMNGINFG
jgi:hypothetical protein